MISPEVWRAALAGVNEIPLALLGERWCWSLAGLHRWSASAPPPCRQSQLLDQASLWESPPLSQSSEPSMRSNWSHL